MRPGDAFIVGGHAVTAQAASTSQMRRFFRADAAFANPEVYEFLEGEGYKYAIRLPANQVIQERIAHLLKRPVGRPPIEVRRYYANFSYQAQSWKTPCRVVAKVEWHPGQLYPTVGFIVTNLSRPAERVVAFYNERGTAEQWIKEGKTRRSGHGCHAARSPPMRCASNSTHSRTILQTSGARWRYRTASRNGRWPACGKSS
jgi:hypothetical protein